MSDYSSFLPPATSVWFPALINSTQSHRTEPAFAYCTENFTIKDLQRKFILLRKEKEKRKGIAYAISSVLAVCLGEEGWHRGVQLQQLWSVWRHRISFNAGWGERETPTHFSMDWTGILWQVTLFPTGITREREREREDISAVLWS